MECNRDEADRCLELAKRFEREGNLPRALKFAQKSLSLFHSEETSTFICKIELRISSSSSSSSSSAASSTTATAPKQDRARNKGKQEGEKVSSQQQQQSEPSYTPEQKAAVDLILKNKRDFYAVLGIKADADEAEIKKAYRKLALKMHPDKNSAPHAEEAFKVLSTAYATLSDSKTRRHYDLHGCSDTPFSSSASNRTRRRRGPRDPFSSSFSFGDGAYATFDDMTAEEIFNMFFGNDVQRQRQHQSTDNVFRQTNFYYDSNSHRAYAFPSRRTGQRMGRGPPEADSFFSSFAFFQMLPLLFLIIISIFSASWFSDPPEYNLFRLQVPFNLYPSFFLFSLDEVFTFLFTLSRFFKRLSSQKHPQKTGAYVQERQTKNLNVTYFVKSDFLSDIPPSEKKESRQRVEVRSFFLTALSYLCWFLSFVHSFKAHFLFFFRSKTNACSERS
ncbi:Chaperone protein dnaJ, variant 2 [Balamuthia mandrillaris]